MKINLYFFSVRFIKNPTEYFAGCFHQSLHGAGTDDERLMQLVVAHCEVGEIFLGFWCKLCNVLNKIVSGNQNSSCSS